MTPTPRTQSELLAIVREALDEADDCLMNSNLCCSRYLSVNDGLLSHQNEARSKLNAALAALDELAAGMAEGVEPRGCPTPGACSCVGPAAPPSLSPAATMREAAARKAYDILMVASEDGTPDLAWRANVIFDAIKALPLPAPSDEGKGEANAKEAWRLEAVSLEKQRNAAEAERDSLRAQVAELARERDEARATAISECQEAIMKSSLSACGDSEISTWRESGMRSQLQCCVEHIDALAPLDAKNGAPTT